MSAPGPEPQPGGTGAKVTEPALAPLLLLLEGLRLDSRTVRAVVVGLGLLGSLFGVDFNQALDTGAVIITDQEVIVDLREGLRLATQVGVASSLLSAWVFRVRRRAP